MYNSHLSTQSGWGTSCFCVDVERSIYYLWNPLAYTEGILFSEEGWNNRFLTVKYFFIPSFPASLKGIFLWKIGKLIIVRCAWWKRIVFAKVVKMICWYCWVKSRLMQIILLLTSGCRWSDLTDHIWKIRRLHSSVWNTFLNVKWMYLPVSL